MAKLETVENYYQILAENIPVLDVRAAIEFNEGSIPGATNAPILNDQERQAVGTCYKQKGRDAAIALGHSIVQGQNRDLKIQTWMKFFEQNPKAYITCFRGGMRSQITQAWLAENNVHVPRLKMGYKGFRTWALAQLEHETLTAKVRVVSGTTGSGKTLFLQSCREKYPVIDLEKEANHRGSAFGYMGIQPSQSDFEHRVLKEFIGLDTAAKQNLLIEDESRLIGQRALPPGVFKMIRSAPVLLIEENIASRIQHIFENYIHQSVENVESTLNRYIQSTTAISKKLGLDRAQDIISDLKTCQKMVLENPSNLKSETFKFANFKWIEKLLVWYYDPMYLGSLEKRNPVVEFRGTRAQLKDYLKC